MDKFVKPSGVNFSSENELFGVDLSQILCKTVSFIQQLKPYEKLEKFDDWWEHDGLHFHRGEIGFDELFKIIDSPENLLRAMTGNFDVFVGVAPKDNSWYLRFYLDWEENEENSVGRFDVTFPPKLAEIFEKQILKQFGLEIKRQNAAQYYQSIVL